MVDTLEIVVPVWNEQECLNELMARLLKLKAKMSDVSTSFIFVNDGSKDKSLSILQSYAKKYPFVKIINFSRNFGHQMALTAALDHSAADFVAIIDADLQDPPELIEDMYKLAKQGNDIVYGKRKIRDKETIFKKVTAAGFYRFINMLCDIDIPVDTGDFRLINKKVVKELSSMREKHRFIRGMVPWVGFKSVPLLYHRKERFAGVTKYSLKRMLRFAKDAIFSFSVLPLRVGTYIGFAGVLLSVITGFVVVYLRFFTQYTVPGISATLLAILFIGSIQMMMLGIMGEYVGRIFEEAKNRPLYIIKDSYNFQEIEKKK